MDRLPEAVKRELAEADRLQASIDAASSAASAPAGSTPDGAAPHDTHTLPPEQDVKQELELVTQRYRALQGKYNAEVPRMHEQNRALETRIAQLEADAQAKAAAVPPAPIVSDADREVFGEDLMEAVDRIATARTAALRDELKHRDDVIARLEAQVTGVTEGMSKDAFFAVLDRALPQWEQINVDPRFNAWLRETDELTGLPRKAILDRHVDAADATLALAVFKAFLAQLPPPAANPLNNQVAPSRGSAGNAAPVDSAGSWTNASIQQFYDDVRRGRITPERAAQMEADLMSAVAEGRITA